jgi:hypothetical protein
LINSGNFACSNRPGPIGENSYSLNFVASLENNSISGVWSIAVFNEMAGHILGGEEHGTVTGGMINATGYALRGEKTFDGVCSNPIHNAINITGNCAASVSGNPNVEFRGVNGETGSFLSDVRCTP